MASPVSSVTPEISSTQYDFEQAECSLSEVPTTAQNKTAPTSENPQVAELVAGYASTDHPVSPKKDCDLKAIKAGIACAQAGLLTLEAAPTLVGGLVAGFLGGAMCGIALAEAVECLRDDASKQH